MQLKSRRPLADEAALVSKAKGDARAFGVLYEHYVDAVYRYCHRRLGEHQDAEDATAATFGSALQGLRNFEWTGAPFGAWLFRIASHRVADLLKARGRTVTIECWDGLQANDDAQLDDLIEEEEQSELWRSVNALPFGYKRVLVLRFGQGLTNQEVARILNRSETATKQQVYRALQMLRSRFATREEVSGHG